MRQRIVECLPGQLVLDPDFPGRGKVLRMVEAGRRHVDDVRSRRALIGQWRTATGAESADDFRGRPVPRRRTCRQFEISTAKDDPCHGGGAARPSTRPAMTQRRRHRVTCQTIADCLAQTTAFRNLAHVLRLAGERRWTDRTVCPKKAAAAGDEPVTRPRHPSESCVSGQ